RGTKKPRSTEKKQESVVLGQEDGKFRLLSIGILEWQVASLERCQIDGAETSVGGKQDDAIAKAATPGSAARVGREPKVAALAAFDQHCTETSSRKEADRGRIGRPERI